MRPQKELKLKRWSLEVSIIKIWVRRY